MIDYYYRDFADLICKDHGEAIASQRLLDAINKIRMKEEGTRIVVDTMAVVVQSILNWQKDIHDSIKRVEAKVDSLNEKVCALDVRWVPPMLVTPYPLPAFPPEGPTCQTNVPTAFTPPPPETKSFAEKEYSDNTAPKKEKP